MAAISGKQATDERATCLRIFADANGESHMEDVEIVLQPKELFKDGRALISRTTSQLLGTTSATYPRA